MQTSRETYRTARHFFRRGRNHWRISTCNQFILAEVKDKFHVDAWRQITNVGGYIVDVVEKKSELTPGAVKLFFINLGGYKAGEFEEFHYRMIVAAADKSAAIRAGKQTAFYKHTGIKSAPAHVDDKYGIDVDDLYQIDDLLMPYDQNHFSIQLTASTVSKNEDTLQLGYFPIRVLK